MFNHRILKAERHKKGCGYSSVNLSKYIILNLKNNAFKYNFSTTRGSTNLIINRLNMLLEHKGHTINTHHRNMRIFYWSLMYQSLYIKIIMMLYPESFLSYMNIKYYCNYYKIQFFPLTS